MAKKFRNQFYFGFSHSCEGGFQSFKLPSGQFFAHQEDAPVAVEVSGSSYTILVGFCFDWTSPEKSMQEICKSIQIQNVSELASTTNNFAGRFVIIKSDGKEILALNDAAGTFPIFYHESSEGINIASSSRLIEKMHPGRPVNEKLSDKFKSLQETPGRHAGFFFPLSVTNYEDVFALLPNHLIDLKNGRNKRIFPIDGKFGHRKAREAVPSIAVIMRGIVDAASRHYNLHLAATGGFDSLVVQSAISSLEGLPTRTNLFTFQFPHDPNGEETDIKNPRKAARIMGASHKTISSTTDGASDYITHVCRSSEEFYATGFEGWVEACDGMSGNDDLIMMGWASEIARGFYRWPGSYNVSTNELMRCAGFQDMTQFYPEFDKWRQEAIEVEKKSGIRVLDLFYWENRVGRWCGPGLNILNLSANWMTPFSCRALLNEMLSVREKDRSGRRQKLYRKLSNELDPSLNSIDPNPITFSESFSQLLKIDAKNFALLLAIKCGVDTYIRKNK